MRRIVRGLTLYLLAPLVAICLLAPEALGQVSIYILGRGGQFTTPVYFPNGTAALPSMSFASEPTLGFYRNAAGEIKLQGVLNTSATIVAASTITGGAFRIGATALIQAPTNGNLSVANTAGTIGAQLKVDALPTAGTCGASPTVTAGSTPLAGSIMVGTDTPASCILIFGGTAFPSAPFCTANVVTATAGSTRAIGTVSTATQVTFTPASAFAASSTVAYHCISSK